MDRFNNGDFSVPEGYSGEEIEGQLCFEDLDEDSELWLIRVPISDTRFQLSDLDRKKVYLASSSNDVNFTNIKAENGKIIGCFVENCKIQNMSVLLPKRDSKKLQVVPKVFEGAILISDEISSNDDPEVKIENAEDSQSIVMDDSTSSPYISKRKKKTKNSHNPDSNYETDIADNGSLPIRKHRKATKCMETSKENNERSKNSHNLDSNYETDIADNGRLPNRKHRKATKRLETSKENNERSKIKTELESMDSDEFPTCISQN